MSGGPFEEREIDGSDVDEAEYDDEGLPIDGTEVEEDEDDEVEYCPVCWNPLDTCGCWEESDDDE